MKQKDNQFVSWICETTAFASDKNDMSYLAQDRCEESCQNPACTCADRPFAFWTSGTDVEGYGVGGALAGLRGQDQADDQAVQAQSLSEDKNQHHADVQLRLLRRRAHASIAHNADSDASGHATEAAREASCKVREAGERGILRRVANGQSNLVSDNHGDDQVRLHDTHGRHANAALGRAVCGTQVGEDQRHGSTLKPKNGADGGQSGLISYAVTITL